MKVYYVKLSHKAVTPSRSSEASAGFDLYAAESAIIPAKGRACIKTDIQIELPDSHYGRVCSRSSLAVNHGIDVAAGVIDADFRGNLTVVLHNTAETNFEVRLGARIAQLIVEKIATPEWVEVTALNVTERGSKGFGSSGI